MTRRPGPPPSLLAALFGRIGALMVAIILAIGVMAYISAQRRIDEIYDGQLIIGANVLRALMAEELHAPPVAPGAGALEVDDAPLLSREDRRAFDNYAEWRMFRVWRGGQLALRSDTGPLIARPPATEGFSQTRDHRWKWRVYTLRVPDSDVTVQVGERTDIRLVLVTGVVLGLAIPLLALIPTVAVLIWLSLNQGLSSLRVLIDQIGQRTLRDLSPLELNAWPRDLHPLVRSINLLLERINRARQQERRFLDDAAHQLRTPLAAVKLQAQMIAHETEPAERESLTRALVEGVDRASNLTDQLLTLARLEAQLEVARGGDLRREAVAALADLAPLAARRGVGFSFEGEVPACPGDPVLLRLIAVNLIENAIHHAPPGSEITVRLGCTHDTPYLEVIDQGPGIPASERDKVVRRFYRGAENTERGSGLGLAIVLEAARLLDGQLVLGERGDGGPGLRARVEFPQPTGAFA
ncbi:ATP-binding protein [Phenylobacterium aquaticum]|uniref:ATP-binding protein n=1 Tax=Phenylobacterium aquaticum TaxID=1763816 RepID=UPI0026F0A596|nr:ATP-binding protein [Phenylobacterium aquaticum]